MYLLIRQEQELLVELDYLMKVVWVNILSWFLILMYRL